MSILDSSSYVLRPSRSAGGNSSTTDEATTGVDRDHLYPEEFPAAYVVKPTDGPVEPYGDMYRAAVLLQPSDRAGKQEYCLFAATTGSLSTIEDASFVVTGGSDSVQVIPGSLSVGGFEDGTTSFYIRDEGARDVSSVVSISIVVGGTSVTNAVTCTVTSYDALTGRVEIDASGIGGGYSEERGDTILAAYYVLAGVSFWWTRNDTVDGVSRFGWNGKVQKWLPLPGTPARSLGAVDPDEAYTLNPAPTRFEIGDTLPGDPSEGDQYALLRVGLYSDKDSTPLEVRVVSDEVADAGWDGGGGDAIVGVNSGLLVLSDAFIEVNAGRTLWYNAETFVPDADGDMGVVADFPIVDNQGFPSLSPAPGPTERPFLRIGNRQYLTPIPKEDDTSLNSPSGVPSGSFEWSKTTGKIVLSAVDIAKCTPGFSTAEGDPADYEIPYLGARLFFDGVALSTQPIPVRGPSYCIDAEGDGGNGSPITGDPDGVPTFGDLFVDRAKPLPPPGVSGVSWVPDNSGVVPDGAAVPVPDPPQTRPNGTGLVRQVKAEAGDMFFFNGNTGGSGYAYENVDIIEYDEDVTKLEFRIPKTDVEVARQSKNAPSNYPYSSQINMRRRPVKGDGLLFRQAMVIPSVYSDTARVYSRFMGPYQLDGTETLRYALGGTEYLWTAPGSGSYTASDIAASFPVGHAGHQRGILYLEDPSGTDIEIGWHLPESSGGPPRGRFELSAHAALGLLPGWKIVAGDSEYRWLPDNGVALGVFRSPTNLDRSDPTPDIRARSVLKNEVLTDNIPAVPFITINQPPLEDIPGYEEDSHFRVRSGLLRLNLKNYQTIRDIGLKYDWPNDRMQWIREGKTNSTEIAFPSSVLQLADTGVLPETVSSDAMLDGAFGLDLKSAKDDSFSELTQGTEFLMPGGGNPGQAFLVEVAGETKYQGGNGTFVAGDTLFSDPNTTIGSVPAGYLLHIINGDAEGVYTFTDSFLNVSPAFPASAGFPLGPPAQWKIYEAKTRGEVDNTLLADVQQTVQNHLSEEPFKIRLLTYAGDVGSTLTVNPSDAIRSGRIVRVRFGLESGSPEAVPSYLVRGTDLGPIATDGLFVDPTDPHVSNSGATVYFQIRVGAEIYVPTVNGGGGLVDVDTTTGEVFIDPNVVSDQTGSSVFYDQIFLSPSDLSAGECEIDSSDGSVNLSGADTSSYSGAKAYFVEQMVTENNLDVTTSPLNGSLLFNKPLRAMQIVEVNYFQADTNGDKALDSDGNEIEVTEFLPLVVRLETATRIDGYTYSYNPTGRTESSTVEPFMWVGVELQNFAGVTNAVANEGTITFTNEVSETDTVQINYGVLEAFGGEQAYTVSTPPVYRKPFWIDAESSSFPLQSDKTSVFEAGDLVLVGETPLYVTGSSYDASTEATTVSFFPTTQGEVGSRAVGRDVSLTVSDFKVAVDYGGDEGFMPTLNTDAITGTPLQPADRGQLEVSFYGDVRAFTRASHILEIDGYPYLIISSSQSADGRNTVVTVGTPLYKDHDNSQKVRVSVRPVHTPGPTEFVGLGPLVPTEEFDLFLMGRTESSGNPIPGKNLIEGVHYTLDPTTGSVVFQSPTQGPLQAGEYLHFRYMKLVEVTPEIVDGALLYPLYKSKYLAVSTPSSKNGILGKVLKAKYTYRNQDSFFFEVLPLLDYLPEVESASSSQGITPIGGGAVPSTPGETPLNKQGRFGLRGETQDYLDQDRAARAYVEFFNGVILAFEQVLEAIDGRIIGDRDGKFRFFVGRGARYARPGWEDEITGDLVARLVWREVVNEWAPDGFDGWYRTTDPVFDPTTAEVPDASNRPGETNGVTPNPDTLRFFANLQRNRIKNDMDDRLLVGFGRPRGFATLFPSIDVPGLFKAMWMAHRYSRLFPEATKHFSRLFPGIEYVPGSSAGFYTSGRKVAVPGPEPGEETEQVVKTQKSAIGQIANPALGNVENVVDITSADRLPRARVWAYYPDGNADLGTAGQATIVATPLPLGEFPIDPTTGYPDPAQLLSGGGDLYDLVSGDVDLATPAFTAGQRVNYGKPTGAVYDLTDSSGNGIFVDQVTNGYIITLADQSGSGVTGSSILYNGTDPLEDIISVDDGYGDTVFCGPVVPDITTLVYPPTSENEIQELIEVLPDYRIQFDLKVGKRTGEFIDASLPTNDDVFPLPLQNWNGQRPPQPLTCIEGEVEFVNTDSEPVQLPCLLGQDKDDSGDYQIPYIRGADTELSVLGRVAADFRYLFEDTTGTPSHTWKAIYPDEIIASDGTILLSYDVGTSRDPATLYTATDLTPVATAGSYTPNSGIGDARPYDLLLVQTEQSPAGITGILSIGDAASSKVEVPRFVTKVNADATSTDLVRHTIRNAAVAVGGGGTTGVIVTETNPFPGLYNTTFNCDSVGFVLDDGFGGGVGATGGFNQFLGAGRVAILRVYSPSTGALIEEIAVSGLTVWSTLVPAGTAMIGAPYFSDGQLFVETSVAISTVANDGNYYDVTVSVDCYIDAVTSALTGLAVGSGVGTTTASVQSDRLTFTETTSLAKAADRTTTTATGAVNVGTSLAVWELELAGGVTGCTVNAPASVNGGDPFTFLERLNGVTPYVGTFASASAAGAGDEVGTIRVMSWEGHNNTPVSTTGLTFGAVPSSDYGAVAEILRGTGTILDSLYAGANLRYRAWIQNVTVLAGGLNEVQSGDILTVSGSGAIPNNAAVKSGTYLVRHKVTTNGTDSGVDILRVSATANAGNSNVIDLRFPKVLSSDEAGTTLTTSLPALITSSVSGPTHAFPASGRVYLILKDQYATFDGVANWVVDASAVYSAAYTSVVENSTNETLTFSGLTDFKNAHGSGLLSSSFFAAAQRNVKVSGMTYFPNRLLASTLPENNVLGFNADGALNAFGGVAMVYFASTLAGGGSKPFNSTFANLKRNNAGVIVNDDLLVRVPFGRNSTAFYEARDVTIYPPDSITGGNPIGVATYLETTQFTNTSWDQIHFDSVTGPNNVIPATPELNCLLPGDRVRYADQPLTGGAGKFIAVSGVFLEPSMPRPVGDLSQALPHVVANSYTNNFDNIGLRDYDDFNAVAVGSEDVYFEVRRIRRFHEQPGEVAAGLEPLRYVYEIRRGEVSSYTASSRQFVALTGGIYTEATNLGAFNNPDVNIHSGDVLRIIDPSTGAVTDTAEVQRVVDPVTLKLRKPGLANTPPAGALFEIYLEQAIVPHEQSNEQLLELITDKVVFERRVDYPGGDTDGGFVSTVNDMQDTTVTSWQAEGVVSGDYVVVDPAGRLYLDTEFGARPTGDRSVIERGAVYTAGVPSVFDDNRGFYRVTDAPATGVLTVDGTSRFSDGTKFGDAGAEYVVLPTINNGTTENQQDLRVTAAASGGSFAGSPASIQPFAYRIIRPNGVFSQDAVELVLFMRERMLSWIGALNDAYVRGGDYYVFQRDDHIKNLREFGVLHNSVVENLEGLVDTTPFANTADCLSILDRRFWTLDFRLDSLPIGAGTTYTQFADDGFAQRPVLPDLIEEVLNLDDKFRDQRYSWISFRANRTDGSIRTAKRAENSLESRLRKQREAINRSKGLKKS
jgi:hypothetical protein